MLRPGMLAWVLWAFVLALWVASLALRYLNGSAIVASLDGAERLSELLWWDILVPAAIPAYATVGAVVAARQPRNAVGWLCLGVAGLVACQEAGWEYAARAFEVTPGELPAGVFVAWITYVLGLGTPLMFVLLLLFFPNGRLPSPRWRLLCWVIAAIGAVGMFASILAPRIYVGTGGTTLPNPTGMQGFGGVTVLVEDASLFALPVLLLAAVVSVVFRWRRAGGVERLQLKWISLAGCVAAFMIACGVAGALISGMSYATVILLGAGIGGITVGVPLAIGVAVLRYRLYDIDLVINRTLVYGTLTACVVGIYVLVVGYLGAVFRVQDNLAVSLLATGAVAVLFAPLRERLQRGADRLMYGDRNDPYAVLTRLGRRLEAALAPQETLQTIVGTVAEALKLPHTAVALRRGDAFETAAEIGEPAGKPLVLPLSYGAETIGRLVLSSRAPNEPFTNGDLRLLDDLARQVGVAAHAVRLTADLQRSREKLVAAREEERRRLRRDLHDGVGPQLAALTLKLETARYKLAGDAEAMALLADLAERSREAVADIRRAVYDLRPPALDELGLVPALRETAAQYGRGGGLRVSVDAPESLPPLPAAVEVAAYRIAGEAMINAARHSGGEACAVAIALDEPSGALLLEVSDDGRGLGEERGTGVGLHSMRERAEELGGACAIETSANGVRVSARLPLEASGFRLQASGKTTEPVGAVSRRYAGDSGGEAGSARKDEHLKPDA